MPRAPSRPAGSGPAGSPSAQARTLLLEFAITELLPPGSDGDALNGVLERVAADLGARAVLVVAPGTQHPLGEEAAYPPAVLGDPVLLAQVRSAWAAHGPHAAASGHAFTVDLGEGPGSARRSHATRRSARDAPARREASRQGTPGQGTPGQDAADQGAGDQGVGDRDASGSGAVGQGAPGQGSGSHGAGHHGAGLLVVPAEPAEAQRPCALALVGDTARWKGGTRATLKAVATVIAALLSRPVAVPAQRHPPARAPHPPVRSGLGPASADALARALVADAPTAIVGVDSSRRIREFNPAAEELFGRSRADTLGRDMLRTLVPERHRRFFASAMARYLAAGDWGEQGRRLRVRALRADGTERSADLTPVPVTVNGETYFFGCLYDVTELENAALALAEGDARFRLLSDLTPVGIMQLGVDDACRFVNSKWSELTGMPADEVAGRDWRSMVHPDDVRRIELLRDKAGPVRELATDCRLLTAAGGELWVNAVVRRVWDARGRLIGRVAAATDVDQRKRAAEAADQDRSRLSEQNIELRDLGEARMRYLATVSHELRTPLTSVVSFAELIRSECPELSASTSDYLDVIERNAERLLRIVGDLLDLSSLEEGLEQLDLEPVSVPAVARESVRAGSAVAAADGISLDIFAQDGPPVRADEIRLQQVLDNLISNAVKFTGEGGRVDVRAACDGAQWQIDVADSGPGIPASELDHLFDRFYRASNARQAAVPGTGLGLPTARAITERLGGRIEVNSKMGTGTTFTVYLPTGR